MYNRVKGPAQLKRSWMIGAVFSATQLFTGMNYLQISSLIVWLTSSLS